MTAAQTDFSDRRAETSWRAAVAKVLKGADFDTLVTHSLDGIALQPLYPGAAGTSIGGIPQACEVVQRIDHPDPEAATRQIQDETANGAQGLILCFEGAATARGFGLSARSAGDFGPLLEGLDLNAVKLRLELPPFDEARVPFALLRHLAGYDYDVPHLAIDIGLDPLGDMARRGTSPCAWPELARRTSVSARKLRDGGLAGPLLRADGRPYHEAGASEAQELAAVLATGLAGLRALESDGWDLEAARDALSFGLAADTDAFLGLAKFRALRRLWAGVETVCGLEPKPIRLHVETAWRVLTRRDPWGNILRGTMGCVAAILGGADSVTVLPFTNALGLPDAAARRLARNTPLVLLEEANLRRMTDPAAGSGAFEALTGALCEQAWALLQEIEAMGGMAEALTSGRWQARLAATRAQRQQDIATGKSPIIGTNRFPNPGEVSPAVLMPPVPSDDHAAPSFPVLPSLRDAEPFESEASRP